MIFRYAVRLAVFVMWIALASVSTASATERVVDLTASDGMKLKATFFAADKPGPGVLLLHQCNRQRKVWDDLGRQLAAAGINVLTLDYRGFGESGGQPFDKLPPEEQARETQKWPSDIDTAFQYLVSQPGVMQGAVGAGGASCGVNNAVQLARRHSEVKSLVLLSGPTNLDGREFLRHSEKVPAFFAVAEDDEFPPSLLDIEWYYSLDANPGKRLVRYATGGHGADMFRTHPDLETKIVDWYVTTLISTPGRAPISKESPPVPPETHVLDLLDQPGGAAKVSQMLAEARQKDPKAELFPEAVVNIMGYEHMQSGHIKASLEILKLNAAAFPSSPNVYDSLGDAYLADGQKDLARENAKKALDLLPSDTADNRQTKDGIRASAEAKLKQLGETPQ
jgi:dienelactone hydrolase